MEKITLLVSVKNREDTIKNCVESLLNIDYPEKKILIIDNISTDKTPQILKKFGDKIEVYRQAGGLSEVFNWALSRTTTKHIAITDSDCVVDKKWVNELLKPFSKEKDVVATAGYCGTPNDTSFLQKLIGLELENRFKKFPKYIERAPTMNLCLNVEIARKVKFDEDFNFQAFEADFGYRLTKYGKIFYNPKAIIWHYHRSTLKNFFLQQKGLAKGGLKLFFKHGKKAITDHITTPRMTLHLFLFILTLISFIFLFFNILFFYLFFIFLSLLLSVYLENIIKIKPPPRYYPAFFGFFLFRNFAWLIGVIEGIFVLAKRLFFAIRKN